MRNPSPILLADRSNAAATVFPANADRIRALIEQSLDVARSATLRPTVDAQEARNAFTKVAVDALADAHDAQYGAKHGRLKGRVDAAGPAFGYWDPMALVQRFALEMETPERKYAANLLQSRSNVDPGANVFQIYRRDYSGEAIAFNGATPANIPRADVGSTFYNQPVMWIIASIEIGIRERMNAAFAKSDLWGDRIKSAMRAYNAKRNHLVLHGEPLLKFYGLANSPYIRRRRFSSLFTSASTGVAISNELATWLHAARNESGGAFMPDSMWLGGRAHQYIANASFVANHPQKILPSFLEANGKELTSIERIDDFNDRGPIYSGTARRDLALVFRGGTDPSLYVEDPMPPTLLVDTSDPLMMKAYVVGAVGGIVSKDVGSNTVGEIYAGG